MLTLAIIRACFRYSFTLFIVVLIAVLSQVSLVHAADITVNDTCSLKNAITAANTDTATGGCRGRKRRGHHHLVKRCGSPRQDA